MHYREFGTTWNAFLSQDEPYAQWVRIDSRGEGTIYVEPNDLPAEKLSLEFGEMLYQLRAALDSLVYEVAVIDSGQDPPPDAEHLEFPIRDNASSFENAARKIAPLSDQHRWMVESIQPYGSEDRPDGERLMGETLEVINDLARKDRHRGLRVIASWGSNKNPQLGELPAGCSLEWLVTTPDGILENESEVARFKIRGWSRGLHVEANPNLAIDVTVKDAAPPRDDADTMSSRSRMMIAVVAEAIEGFEQTLG